MVEITLNWAHKVFRRLSAIILMFGLPVVAQAEDAKITKPWTEAVVSVTDLEVTARFFTQVAGYERLSSGETDRTVLDYWGLGEGVSAKELRLGKPRMPGGTVRLMQFSGAKQHAYRAGGRPWDTGGYFSLMTRAKGLRALWEEAIKLGWNSESRVINFKYRTSDLDNVVFSGPDGLKIAAYERLSPELEGWPEFTRLTPPFNAMQMMVRSEETSHFYKNIMGFAVYGEGDFLDPEPTHNNFGLPQNFVTKIPRRGGIYYPSPMEDGRMETMAFPGMDGQDRSADAVPPNLGILMVRYPIEDLDAWRETLVRRGAPIAYQPTAVTIDAIGQIEIFATRTPDGALIEFYGARE